MKLPSPRPILKELPMRLPIKFLGLGALAVSSMIACNLGSDPETPSTPGPVVLPSIQDDSYEPDNDFEHATALATDSTIQNHALVKDSSHSSEYDYVVLRTKPGTDYNLDVVAKPYLPTVYVERPEGGFLNFKVLSSRINDSSASQTVSFTAADTLTYIRIGYENHSKVEDWGTQYSITATVLPEARALIDSTPRSSLKFASVFSAIDTVSKTGWYKIPPTNGRSISFGLYQFNQGTRGVVSYHLFSSDSTLIKSQPQHYSPASADSIYLYIEPNDANYLFYYKLLTPDTTEPNNRMFDARALPTHESGITSQLLQDDVDWFKIAVDSGVLYEIKFHNEGTHTEFAFELFNRQAHRIDPINLIDKRDRYYSEDPKPHLFYASTHSDTLYMKATFIFQRRSFERGYPSTQLHVYDSLPFHVAVVSIPNDDYEPQNNKLTTAPTISTNGVDISGVSILNEEDYYRFTADSGTFYVFRGISKAQIFTVDSQIVLSPSGDFTFVPLNPGQYFVNILSSLDGNYSRYTMTVLGIKMDAFEPDGDMSHSKLLASGQNVTHHNLPAFDEDWMVVPVDSGATYNIGMTTSSPIQLTVFNEDSLELGGGPSIATIGTNHNVKAITQRRAGKIYLRISHINLDAPYPIEYTLGINKL